MHLTSRLVKQDGVMIFQDMIKLQRYQLFRGALKEGQEVEIYLDVLNGNKSLGQLAKVHKVIRTIAATTGHEFDEVKKEVKEKAGLFVLDGQGNYQYKSFGDCSRDELGLAIEEAQKIGDFVGIVPFP